jgi:hypothetical protein
VTTLYWLRYAYLLLLTAAAAGLFLLAWRDDA